MLQLGAFFIYTHLKFTTMLLNVVLKQTNSNDDVTFSATKKISTGKADNLNAVSKEVAQFLMDFNVLVNKNIKRGYTSLKGVRKTQPLTVLIQGLGDDKDINVSLTLKSFGKFLEGSTKANLEGLLNDNISFIDSNGDWS